jgi:hypothetical protein
MLIGLLWWGGAAVAFMLIYLYLTLIKKDKDFTDVIFKSFFISKILPVSMVLVVLYYFHKLMLKL